MDSPLRIIARLKMSAKVPKNQRDNPFPFSLIFVQRGYHPGNVRLWVVVIRLQYFSFLEESFSGMANAQNHEFFLPLRETGDMIRIQRGVECAVDTELVRIEFIRPDVARVSISSGGEFDLEPTHAVVTDDFGEVPFTLKRSAEQIVLATGALTVQVNLCPFSFDVFRADGSPVLRSVSGKAYSFLNGSWRVEREKRPNDGIFGLGQKTGPLNRNGRSFVMWNTDIMAHVSIEEALDPEFDPYYISIPFFYHLSPTGAASGSFIDNGYRLRYDFTAPGTYTVEADGGQYTEYIFAGPSMQDILSRYTELTGRMPLPPLWALGHHQCRWHDYQEDDIRSLARTYREKGIPCDVLWLDIDYMDDFRIFTWDREKFPDPAVLSTDMEKQGFRLITIIDPGVKHDPGYPVYDQGARRDLFCKAPGGMTFVGKVWPGHTVFPDFVKKETREWWADLVAGHTAHGNLAGAWIDMNEPAFTEADERRMLFDHEGETHPHERWRNQYGLLMAQCTRAGLEKARPGQRQFVLSRAGFAGIQRYAANWMGDNGARWEHLALSVALCCGTSMSGQPFVGSDIGGFAGDTTAELLVRWYQYGVFQPFCRNHSMKDSSDQYPWSFGKRVEDSVRQSLEMRYRLLPAIYSAFARSAETGEPIQRPLVYNYPHDIRTWEVNDQFLFGDHILVAPVVTPGTRERRVYLPEGGWYALDFPACHPGGRDITVSARLEKLPVFVRAGAIIPAVEAVQSTVDYTPEEIILNVYLPVESGEWVSYLQEDDGLTERWREGELLRTEFRVIHKDGRATLYGTVTGKRFPGFKRTAFRVRVIGEGITETVIPNTGEDFVLEIC